MNDRQAFYKKARAELNKDFLKSKKATTRYKKAYKQYRKAKKALKSARTELQKLIAESEKAELKANTAKAGEYIEASAKSDRAFVEIRKACVEYNKALSIYKKSDKEYKKAFGEHNNARLRFETALEKFKKGDIELDNKIKSEMKKTTFKTKKDRVIEKLLKNAKAEGRRESQVEIISNILKKQKDISIISKITGLTKKEIKKLLQKAQIPNKNL